MESRRGVSQSRRRRKGRRRGWKGNGMERDGNRGEEERKQYSLYNAPVSSTHWGISEQFTGIWGRQHCVIPPFSHTGYWKHYFPWSYGVSSLPFSKQAPVRSWDLGYQTEWSYGRVLHLKGMTHIFLYSVSEWEHNWLFYCWVTRNIGSTKIICLLLFYCLSC